MTTLDLITTCFAHGLQLEADVDRGVIRWEGDATPALLAALKAHKPALLAVLSRFQRMVEHDTSHDRPPVPMVHWTVAFGPGHCGSCGQVLNDPHATGRCDSCWFAAELFHRTRAARTAVSTGHPVLTTRAERTP